MWAQAYNSRWTLSANGTGWPDGDSEICARIRAHDWAATPLGPVDSWPRSLKTALDIVLACEFPMSVLWGRELIQLYNDAFGRMIAGKHPAAFGSPMQRSWPEGWEFNAAVIDRVWTGETVSFQDQLYPDARHGAMEDAWFTLCYSPLRDDAGIVAGVLVTAFETTRRVRADRERDWIEAVLRESQERQAFLLNLSDALRPLTEAAAIKAEATRRLGQHLHAGRVFYAEVEPDEDRMNVQADYTAPGMPDLSGNYRLSDYGPAFVAECRAGRSVVINDVADHPLVPTALLPAYEALHIRAIVGVPLVKDGLFRAALGVDDPAPRKWNAGEVSLIQEVAARTWDAVERARAERASRESEMRYRAIIDQTATGVVESDFSGNLCMVNPRFCEMVGYTETELLRVRMQDITHPEDLPRNLVLFERLVRTGEAFVIEKRYIRKDGTIVWASNSVSGVRDADGKLAQVVAVVTDITARKRAEAQRELLMHELNHRVKNTLATVQSVVALTLRHAGSTAQAREMLDQRLVALSRAHDVLTHENWESAGLREVVENVAAAYASSAFAGRFEIKGPDLRLRPVAVLSLSMALHELTTNAVKYGALRNDEGKVAIHWWCNGETDRGDGRSPRFRLRWTESGGPPARAPTRRGFGSRLIEEGLAHDLGGAVRMDFSESGLTCQLDAPLREVSGG